MGAFNDRAELDELKRWLDDHAETLCREFFGEPTSRRAHQLRWGRRGSFVLKLHGRNGAVWYAHEAQTGGDVLALIMEQVGIDFAGAVRWARGCSATTHRRGRPELGRERKPPILMISRRQSGVRSWICGPPVGQSRTRSVRDICASTGASTARLGRRR